MHRNRIGILVIAPIVVSEFYEFEKTLDKPAENLL